MVVGHSICGVDSSLVECSVVVVERRRVVAAVAAADLPLAIMVRDVEEKAEVAVAHERIMVMAGGTILI